MAVADADRGRFYQLAVCAIFKNEGRYLREWIEFHRLVGVEKFLLYDNNSTDDGIEILAPYVSSGLVTIHNFPPTEGQQLLCYESCIGTYRDHARWIAFIDLDEFLYPAVGASLVDMLGAYGAHPAVAVNWVMFNTSGHILQPDGLVLESYTRCQIEGNRHVKLVVDPSRVLSFNTSHHANYVDGATAVNERFESVTGPYSIPPSTNCLRINHYFTKSVEEFLVFRQARGHVDITGKSRDTEMLVKAERIYASGDDTTIQRFLPALKAVLGSGV